MSEYPVTPVLGRQLTHTHQPLLLYNVHSLMYSSRILCVGITGSMLGSLIQPFFMESESTFLCGSDFGCSQEK